MNNAEFDGIVKRRMEAIGSTLLKKQDEYAKSNDVFHNFHRASAILHVTRQQALMGMASKHLVSVLDMVDKNAEGEFIPEDLFREKIGDLINYLIILEAMFEEEGDLPF